MLEAQLRRRTRHKGDGMAACDHAAELIGPCQRQHARMLVQELQGREYDDGTTWFKGLLPSIFAGREGHSATHTNPRKSCLKCAFIAVS